MESDVELGFWCGGRRSEPDDPRIGRSSESDVRAWTSVAIVDDAAHISESELINRRVALRLAPAGGAALVVPLTPWSEPLVEVSLGSRRGAAAELAKIAGAMAFDGGHHRSAQQLYITAARLAKAGGSASFGAVALAALARQSFDLGVADDGLQIVQLAQRGTRAVATPRLRAMLATREAWAYAQLGDAYRFRQCVEQAENAHEESARADEPRWLRGFDAAELNGTIGARYRDLARHDRRQVAGAVVHLSRALDLRDARRARNRAFDLVSLGRAHLLADAPDAAASSVAKALPHVDRRRPGRLGRKLADWYVESAPFATVAPVVTVRAAVGALVPMPAPGAGCVL